MKVYNKYFVCLLAVLLAGCNKKKKVTSTASTTMEVENAGVDEVEFTEKSVDESVETTEESNVNLEESSVYFAFDSSIVNSSYMDNLKKLAKWLLDSNSSIVIYGNCDARGSATYNVGLGSRRANAVKQVLVSLGVPASKVISVSTGQQILVPGTSEEAYAKNRVARIEIKCENSKFLVESNSKSKSVESVKNTKSAPANTSEVEDDEDDDN